jgi:hypothetical protein
MSGKPCASLISPSGSSALRPYASRKGKRQSQRDREREREKRNMSCLLGEAMRNTPVVGATYKGCFGKRSQLGQPVGSLRSNIGQCHQLRKTHARVNQQGILRRDHCTY